MNGLHQLCDNVLLKTIIEFTTETYTFVDVKHFARDVAYFHACKCYKHYMSLYTVKDRHANHTRYINGNICTYSKSQLTLENAISMIQVIGIMHANYGEPFEMHVNYSSGHLITEYIMAYTLLNNDSMCKITELYNQSRPDKIDKLNY